MKNKLITILLLTLTGFFSSSIFAAPESANEQLEDAKDASEKAANTKDLGEARENAGGQFDYDYDRSKNAPEGKEAPNPGEPKKVGQ